MQLLLLQAMQTEEDKRFFGSITHVHQTKTGESKLNSRLNSKSSGNSSSTDFKTAISSAAGTDDRRFLQLDGGMTDHARLPPSPPKTFQVPSSEPSLLIHSAATSTPARTTALQPTSHKTLKRTEVNIHGPALSTRHKNTLLGGSSYSEERNRALTANKSWCLDSRNLLRELPPDLLTKSRYFYRSLNRVVENVQNTELEKALSLPEAFTAEYREKVGLPYTKIQTQLCPPYGRAGLVCSLPQTEISMGVRGVRKFMSAKTSDENEHPSQSEFVTNLHYPRECGILVHDKSQRAIPVKNMLKSPCPNAYRQFRALTPDLVAKSRYLRKFLSRMAEGVQPGRTHSLPEFSYLDVHKDFRDPHPELSRKPDYLRRSENHVSGIAQSSRPEKSFILPEVSNEPQQAVSSRFANAGRTESGLYTSSAETLPLPEKVGREPDGVKVGTDHSLTCTEQGTLYSTTATYAGVRGIPEPRELRFGTSSREPDTKALYEEVLRGKLKHHGTNQKRSHNQETKGLFDGFQELHRRSTSASVPTLHSEGALLLPTDTSKTVIRTLSLKDKVSNEPQQAVSSRFANAGRTESGLYTSSAETLPLPEKVGREPDGVKVGTDHSLTCTEQGTLYSTTATYAGVRGIPEPRELRFGTSSREPDTKALYEEVLRGKLKHHGTNQKRSHNQETKGLFDVVTEQNSKRKSPHETLEDLLLEIFGEKLGKPEELVEKYSTRHHRKSPAETLEKIAREVIIYDLYKHEKDRDKRPAPHNDRKLSNRELLKIARKIVAHRHHKREEVRHKFKGAELVPKMSELEVQDGLHSQVQSSDTHGKEADPKNEEKKTREKSQNNIEINNCKEFLLNLRPRDTLGSSPQSFTRRKPTRPLRFSANQK
ncbi:unnamed protein product [Calicophoron daubneyi]